MKTLEQHNQERRVILEKEILIGNGIKCANPETECDGELFDTGEKIARGTWEDEHGEVKPLFPKVGVKCLKCSWEGYRFE